MKFLSVRELRNQPGKVWKSVKRSEVVLTANGKPVAILMGVEENALEETLILLRRARAQAAVSKMRFRAAKTGANTLSNSEIDAEIQSSRRKRKSRINRSGV